MDAARSTRVSLVTPLKIKFARQALGVKLRLGRDLSQAELGLLIGLTGKRGDISRTVRAWESPPRSARHRSAGGPVITSIQLLMAMDLDEWPESIVSRVPARA